MKLTTERMREYQRERRAKLKPKKECPDCRKYCEEIDILKLTIARITKTTPVIKKEGFKFCDKHGKMNNMCGCK